MLFKLNLRINPKFIFKAKRKLKSKGMKFIHILLVLALASYVLNVKSQCLYRSVQARDTIASLLNTYAYLGVTYSSFIEANPGLASYSTTTSLASFSGINGGVICISMNNSITATIAPITKAIPFLTFPTPASTFASIPFTLPTVTIQSTTTANLYSICPLGYNYAVRTRDSCASIVAIYSNSNPSLFYSINPSVNCNNLVVGQLICVPNYYGDVYSTTTAASVTSSCTNCNYNF